MKVYKVETAEDEVSYNCLEDLVAVLKRLAVGEVVSISTEEMAEEAYWGLPEWEG